MLRLRRRSICTALLVCSTFPGGAVANHGVVERLPDGPGHVSLAGMSEDGRHVYLATSLPLLQEDTNGLSDVYDFSGGALTLITVPQDPLARQDGAYFGGSSADGSRVFFGSRDPFVASDVNGVHDAYERAAGATRLLTTGPGRPDGTGNGYDESLAYSTDGTRFVFSAYDPYVPEDAAPNSLDIYDRVGAETHLLSGWGGADESSSTIGFRSASKDARTVVFSTRQSLVPEDTDGLADLYASIDGTLHVIGPSGIGVDAFGYFIQATNDRSVFFSSTERLTAADTDASIDLYVWSIGGGTRLLSTGPVGGDGAYHVDTSAISPDGTRAYFQTTEQLTVDDTDQASDLYEASRDGTSLVYAGPSGTRFTGVSGDSQHIFFVTDGRLTAEDRDDATDIYESFEGRVRMISTGPTDPQNTFTPRFEASSYDGSRVFFLFRGRLTAADRNDADDLYERFGDTTTLISSGSPSRVWYPYSPGHLAVSPDGERLYFATDERVLPSDADSYYDVYQVSVAAPYVRPRKATPIRASLVPAFASCEAPNETHGPPLAFSACNPPRPSSSSLVMGGKGGCLDAARREGRRPNDRSRRSRCSRSWLGYRRAHFDGLRLRRRSRARPRDANHGSVERRVTG